MCIRLFTSVGLLIVVQLPGIAYAHNGYSFLRAAESRVDFRRVEVEQLRDCAAIKGFVESDLTLVEVEEVQVPDDESALCRVLLRIHDRIRLELNLPRRWNGRFYMHGNGGLGGQFTDDYWIARVRDNALRQGFATAFNDTGHDRRKHPRATFAAGNPDALIDYAHRAVHLSAIHAQALVAAWYGRPASFRYFDGCSNGGRQALIEAQRYPDDFDGILAGAPVLDITGHSLSRALTFRDMQNGTRLSEPQLRLLAARVYARCDALDGKRDGLIDDPRACDFRVDEELPICDAETGSECVTSAQLAVLRRVYDGVHDGQRLVYPGLPVGSEAWGRVQSWLDGSWTRASGWAWLLGDSLDAALARERSFFRYLAFPIERPALELADLELDRDLPKMAERARLLNATDPDLDQFKSRGGKLLTWFGWADQTLNPLPMIAYADDVQGRYGDTAGGVFRLFLLPGVFHCHSGIGPDEFDGMTPLIEWVEADLAPEQIPVTGGAHAPARIGRYSMPAEDAALDPP
ncbi:MAG: tannase/feruloyl esterase family alpha/beta hydrolase [Gammaproteobacteria bacterium]|nr:tannase/feruloyl esterase family alpha/beta hydrolase [Gammaproteobacteria bacterium]